MKVNITSIEEENYMKGKVSGSTTTTAGINVMKMYPKRKEKNFLKNTGNLVSEIFKLLF